jgi:hypothetical protein
LRRARACAFGREIDGHDLARARLGGVHGERARVREEVEHAPIGRALRHGRPAEAHVGEQADAERRGHVDAEAAGARTRVVLDDDLERRLLAARAHGRLGRGLTAERLEAPLLVEPARRERGFDGVVELVSPGERAGRQPLHDHELAVAIDGHARQALALAREHAHGGRACRPEQEPAELDGAREPRGDDAVARHDALVGPAREDANGDLVLAIDVAPPHQLAIPGDQIDDGARGLRHTARAQGVTKHPGMARADARRDIERDPVVAHTNTDGGGGSTHKAGAPRPALPRRTRAGSRKAIVFLHGRPDHRDPHPACQRVLKTLFWAHASLFSGRVLPENGS